MSLNNVFLPQTDLFRFSNINYYSTLKLITSSLSVSLSGSLRIYLASLLLRTEHDFLKCVSAFLIIYSVYTLDRALESKEDFINRIELTDSNKPLGILLSISTFVIGAYILETRGLIGYAFLPFITGYLYSKGIKIGKFSLKLKGGFGIKNTIVGITWGIFIIGLAGPGCNPFTLSMVFMLYGIKVFLNSTADDFKDMKGDAIAGIKTLPIYLGPDKTKTLLMYLHIFSHLILFCMFAELWFIIIISFICGLLVIKYTTGDKLKLVFFKDGESLITIIFVSLWGPV